MTYSLDGHGPAVLHLTPQPQGRRTVIGLGGELDLATADHLPDFLRAMTTEDCREVHLDLADLTFIDVVGLTALVRAGEVVRERAGRMTIGGLRPLTGRLIDILALPVTIDDDQVRPFRHNPPRYAQVHPGT